MYMSAGEVATQQNRHQQQKPSAMSAQHKVALSRDHSPTSRESKTGNDAQL